MKRLTPEEKEKLQAMIDGQDRDQEYLRRVRIEREVSERAARRALRSGFHPLTSNPPLASTVQRTRYHLVSRSKAKLRSMRLSEKEKEELKDKVWGTIRERHES